MRSAPDLRRAIPLLLLAAAADLAGCASGGSPQRTEPALARVLAQLVWPLPFEARRNVRSRYGYRAWGGGAGRYHYGLDLEARRGDPVHSAGAGVVAAVGEGGAYGRYVRVDHGAELSSFYAHLHRRLVRAGDPVQRGQVIGRVGATGNASGPHLHFELRWRDGWVDPLAVLPRLE